MASQLSILSAGAVKPALAVIVDRFRRETGCDAAVQFATAPEIRRRLSDGEKPDVLIAPPDVLDQLLADGSDGSSERAVVGRIGIGIMVRKGAPVPAIGTVAEFKQALLNARALFYNRASTGLYLESLFTRLGLADDLKQKTTRYDDAGPVLERVSKAADGEIGFGATTVIAESEDRGVELAGPLPPEIQNYTTYAAAVVRGSLAPSDAREFVRYLAAPDARTLFAAAGIA